MIGLYHIIKCPSCGTENPVEMGYSQGCTATIEYSVDTLCLNKDCVKPFTVYYDNNLTTKEVDYDVFNPINNDLVGIESYIDYSEQLLSYIEALSKHPRKKP